jgi:5-hydroxyisourate hydrolase
MIRITTHVLDTALGRPAAGVPVRLERAGGEGPPVAQSLTDSEGRVRDWLPEGVAPGRYRLVFGTGEWMRATGRVSLYPEIGVDVELREGERHYHLPLLLSPHGYTTYRGS